MAVWATSSNAISFYIKFKQSPGGNLKRPNQLLEGAALKLRS